MATSVPTAGATPAVDNRFGIWEPTTAKKPGYKILVYGTSGSGKTHFAASFPEPLFIDLEGGMLGVSKFKPLRFPKDPSRVVESVDELIEIGKYLREQLDGGKASFKTVVIDSLNELQDLVMANVLQEFDAKRQYDDQPTQSDYGKANRDVIKIFRSFCRLPCNVVFTSVIVPPTFEEEMVAPSFSGKQVGPVVSRLVDAIGYTYTSRPTKGGDEADIRYMINFANTPEHVGKDRLGIGPKSKPNTYEAVFGTKGA